ncbi:hypothetical protein GCM10009096_18900 [Parasphingorhabdus litoris]|uniref:DUF3224 domain-containing protein n=1 Tax=Parasphingorhabdus litoris TaxID=394733 RepID=A0ABN1AIB9_9SPHN|nr:DUF3224 domain-containing protein [Parasphingorhabdus litoris]
MALAKSVVATVALLSLAGPALAEDVKKKQASGAFEVELSPVSEKGESPARMVLTKSFTGDLIGTGTGQMMADANKTTGARVYVALETITGSLNGKQGSFIVTHHGTMTKTSQNLSIEIVPDSGTDELSGITGTMAIQNVDGKHSYTINYSLPDS